MASDIQLIVLDIDGTLAGANNQVSKPVKQALAAAQQQGIAVAIATGRMYCAAVRFHQAIASSLPLLAYQGALIKDPRGGRVYRHSPLPRNLALTLLDELAPWETQQAISIHLYIDDQLHVRQILSETEAYAARSGIQPLAVGDLKQLLLQRPQLQTTKLLAQSPNPITVSQLLAALRPRYATNALYLTQSVQTFLEATSPMANKGAAVRYLAETLLQLRPQQVMAIGDNFNDLEMIQYAGIGIAMADAPLVVQQQADWVAPSVEADGVATAIEHFLLT
ncbi:Sugar phosphatase YidA [Halomicronema hongdechloris C2206]|uniref:Sugar phosphatase YidA n=1 Tax=Halomicronema hongdechloris C2206 TaxID=1641165 RepID=A0A1Z3HNS9_9CYAN|nr:Cof-type HAD-IIB family hydrolase [Halomicronema hongdechloris]ASC71964.1 Sugar phosphatase YidA [Halomicronema hongdechloris C2206]